MPDMDGLEDYRDRDSDADGITDAREGAYEDVDGDGLVGVSDVLALLSEFGTVCP